MVAFPRENENENENEERERFKTRMRVILRIHPRSQVSITDRDFPETKVERVDLNALDRRPPSITINQ